MQMPSEDVAQVQRLTPQAKVKKTPTFTNTHDEVLEVLTTDIEHTWDDVDLAHGNEELAGVNWEDKVDVNDAN